MAEGKFSTPSKIVTGVARGFILALILYSLYINDAPVAPGTHLALFVDDTAHEFERRVLCKLQCDLTAANSWCEQCNIKINEAKIQAICFSRRLTVHDDIQLSRQDILFVNNVMYLGVTFKRRLTQIQHIEKDCSQGLAHKHRNLFSIKKWVFKYK
jgi:hypothetical protein